MSDRFIFQNARVKSMETKLLGVQQVQRLSEASSADEFVRMLSESGFGAAAGENAGADDMLAAEERYALDLLKELNADGLLDAFVLPADYQNLKALLKASFAGSRSPVLGAEGLFTTEELRAGIDGDASSLRPEMADAVRSVARAAAEGRLTPHGIDCAVDKAMFADTERTAKKCGKEAAEYFRFKTDCANLSSFFRCRRFNLGIKVFEENFMPGGELPAEFFTSAYDAAEEDFRGKCRRTPYGDAVDELAETGSLTAFEVYVDNKLLDMWRSRKDDMFGCAPVVGYYFAKIAEIRAVKLAYSGVKNKVDARLIKERTRELYGA